MPMLDVAGHLAFALILVSFLVRDILWLRALSITASVASISYFVTGMPAAAMVKTIEPTRYLAWEKNALRRLLDRNPSMRGPLQSELAEDMARKMARRTGLTGKMGAIVMPPPQQG